MTTEYLKFPRTYKDLNFCDAPYIHAIWKLTKYKWGEGVQIPFNEYYFPQDPEHENWNLFGNCGEFDMGGKWYGSTLKEALEDLRTDWEEIKRRHKILMDLKKQNLYKLYQDQKLRVQTKRIPSLLFRQKGETWLLLSPLPNSVSQLLGGSCE